MAEHLWANDDACEFVVPTGDMGASALHWLMTGRWSEAACRALPANGATALTEGGYRDVTAEVSAAWQQLQADAAEAHADG